MFPSRVRRPEDKLASFMYAVQEVIPTGQPTIIFASTRHHVELLSQLLRADGIPSAHVYGTMDQVTAARCILLREISFSPPAPVPLSWKGGGGKCGRYHGPGLAHSLTAVE